jgi:phage protein D
VTLGDILNTIAERSELKPVINQALAEGRPDLYPETPVQTLGFKAEIDETLWVLERVVHELNDNGYTTRLEMEVND